MRCSRRFVKLVKLLTSCKMRILTSNLRRAWSPVRLPKQWMPQGAQPVSHSWIRHLYHLVNRQDHPAWRFCQRRKLQVSKTTFLPANLVDLWFVMLCSHFSVTHWWTFVRPKVPLVRLSAELLFGTPIFLEPEPQALKVNIHQSRFQRCTISIHFCLFCLVHLCPVLKFQIFNLCREVKKWHVFLISHPRILEDSELLEASVLCRFYIAAVICLFYPIFLFNLFNHVN